MTHVGQIDCVAFNFMGEVKDSFNLSVGYPPKVVLKPSGKFCIFKQFLL